MDFMKRLWEQIKSLMKNMSSSQKVSLAILGTSIVISATMLIFMSSGTSYARLYDSNVAPEDMDATLKKLQELGLQHEVRDGAVYVPRQHLDTTRFALAGEGVLPEGKDPFGFLGEPNFWSTAKKIDLQHMHALEKSLARTLEKAAGIKRAWINITEHDGSVLVFESEQPRKATVNVQVEGNKKLTDTQVRAIAHMVSAAVPNLSPDHVAISDSKLNFYATNESSEVAQATNLLELRRMYERHDAEKVRDFLSRVMDKVHVAVDVKLDIKKIKKSLHDAGGVDATTVTGSHKIKETEKSTGPKDLPVGTAPENRNLGGASGLETSRDLKDDEITPVDWDKAEELIESTPDIIEKKTVSIIVPYEYVIIPKGEEKAPEDPAAREAARQATLAELRELAKNAVGTTDDTAVAIHDLSVRKEVPEDDKPGQMEMWMGFFQENWYKIALMVFIAAAFVMVFLTLRRTLPNLTVAEDLVAAEEMVVPPLPEIVASPDEIHVEQMRGKIQETASSDPQTAADLISRWMQKG